MTERYECNNAYKTFCCENFEHAQYKIALCKDLRMFVKV